MKCPVCGLEAGPWIAGTEEAYFQVCRKHGLFTTRTPVKLGPDRKLSMEEIQQMLRMD